MANTHSTYALLTTLQRCGMWTCTYLPEPIIEVVIVIANCRVVPIFQQAQVSALTSSREENYTFIVKLKVCRYLNDPRYMLDGHLNDHRYMLVQLKT